MNPTLARTASLLALLLLGASAWARVEPGDYVRPLAPEEVHAETAHDVITRLSRGHYRRIPLDDTLSSHAFDRYLEMLDPSRIYFRADDIAEFESQRTQLDDQLRDGELGPAFTIYNRYQERLAEQLAFMVNQLEDGLDGMAFDGHETVQVDRSEAAWPPGPEAQRALWLARLKNAVLSLRLAEKADDEIVSLLTRRYESQLKRLRQSRNEDAFQAFVNAAAYIFDPHTSYMSPRRSEDFSIDMNLSLEGIGAALQLDNEYTKVVRVIPGGPAYLSKQLKPADRIVSVGQGGEGDLVDIVGWRLDEVVRLIRGPKDTLVRLEIIPAGVADDSRTRIVMLRRDTVRLEDQAASSRLMEFDHEGARFRIGVIRLPTFYVNTTRDVTRILHEFDEQRVDGILLDLRNNGGGSLEEANSLTGLFIRGGPTVQIRNAHGRVAVMRDPDSAFAYDGPLAVLVNRHSASASEIFAGAIKDYNRGLILGSRTFGKGTVQTLKSLDHGRLKLTMAKFYRISGGSTQHQGVLPHIPFPELIDVSETGESALDGALPWDTIAPADYEPYTNLAPLVERLQRKHLLRSAESVEFNILNERIAHQRDLNQRVALSLNEGRRRSEQDAARRFELALENRRRQALGEPPLEALPETPEEDETPVAPNEQATPEENLLVEEGGRVLADLILLSQPISAMR
ncbi:MAG: carboxy terminal-processing peptidase [Gammaproteobacteria bacterium]|nr:carboxy terminal-processing peptidase [Gammaproteobacteria bacterium]